MVRRYKNPAVSGSEYKRLSSRAVAERRRNAAHAAYGGVCICCGETDSAFLTIDHVNEDGATHRRKMSSAMDTYAWLSQHGYPEGFQILCFNCNCARSLRGGGVCPHKIAVDPLAAQKRFDQYRKDQDTGGSLTAEKLVAQVHDLLNEGLKGSEIALKLKIDPSRVSRIKKSHVLVLV